MSVSLYPPNICNGINNYTNRTYGRYTPIPVSIFAFCTVVYVVLYDLHKKDSYGKVYAVSCCTLNYSRRVCITYPST